MMESDNGPSDIALEGDDQQLAYPGATRRERAWKSLHTSCGRVDGGNLAKREYNKDGTNQGDYTGNDVKSSAFYFGIYVVEAATY